MNHKKEQELLKLHKLRSSLINKAGFMGGELFEQCTFSRKQMTKPKRAVISGFACGICARIALDSKKPNRIIEFDSVLDVLHDRAQKRVKVVTGSNYIRLNKITLGFNDDASALKVVEFLQRHCFARKFVACCPLELLFKEWVTEVMMAEGEQFSMSKIDLTSKYFKIMSTLGILASGFGQSITRKIDLKKFTFKAYVDTFKSRYFVDCDYNELFSDLIAKGTLKFGGKTVNEFSASNVHLFDSKKDPVQYKEILPKLLLATSAVEPEMYGSWFHGNEYLDRPLKDYFCSSSHNTYLVLAQYGGYALADPYRYVLLQGVRCVEIDVYDSENQLGKSWPIVTHTQFLNVKPVPLRECLVAIEETAFIASSCPVVISFENHCGEKGQSEIARQLIEIFGDKIVTEKEFNGRFGRKCTLRNCQNRILIKNKKINKVANENKDSSNDNNDDRGLLENDLSSLVSYYEPVKVETKSVAKFNAKCTQDSKALGGPPHYVMSLNEVKAFEFISLNEKVAKLVPQITGSSEKLTSQTDQQEREEVKDDNMEALKFYRNSTLRVYPKMTRLNSSNFNPMQFLAAGCQMVALNFQTLDLNLKSLKEFFMLNGNCGYVLRPNMFNYSQNDTPDVKHETNLNIRVVAMVKQIPGDLKIQLYSFNEKPYKTQTKINAKSTRKVSLINGLATQKFEFISRPECSFVHFKFKTVNGKRFTQFLPLYALSTGYSHLILRDPEGIQKPLVFFAFISCKTSTPTNSKEVPQMSEMQMLQKSIFNSYKSGNGGSGGIGTDQKQIINLLKSAIYGDSLFRFQSSNSQSCVSLNNNNGRENNLGAKNMMDHSEIVQNLKNSNEDDEDENVFNEKIQQIAERLKQNSDLLRKWEEGLENQRQLDIYNLHNASSNTRIKDLNRMLIAQKKHNKMLKKLVEASGAKETFANKNREEICKYVENIRKENGKEKFKIKKVGIDNAENKDDQQ